MNFNVFSWSQESFTFFWHNIVFALFKWYDGHKRILCCPCEILYSVKKVLQGHDKVLVSQESFTCLQQMLILSCSNFDTITRKHTRSCLHLSCPDTIFKKLNVVMMTSFILSKFFNSHRKILHGHDDILCRMENTFVVTRKFCVVMIKMFLCC